MEGRIRLPVYRMATAVADRKSPKGIIGFDMKIGFVNRHSLAGFYRILSWNDCKDFRLEMVQVDRLIALVGYGHPFAECRDSIIQDIMNHDFQWLRHRLCFTCFLP